MGRLDSCRRGSGSTWAVPPVVPGRYLGSGMGSEFGPEPLSQQPGFALPGPNVPGHHLGDHGGHCRPGDPAGPGHPGGPGGSGAGAPGGPGGGPGAGGGGIGGGADPAQAAAAEAAAGNAAGLGVDGCGQRQQPRCGPQVLLAETTGQHLLAEDTVELLSGGQYRGAGVVEPVGQRHQS